MRFEEFHLARFLNLMEGVQNDRRHPALVILVGAVHIEELQPGPEERLAFLRQRPLVEIVLRFAVEVHRFQLVDDLVIVVEAVLAHTVSGCRRGIYKRQTILNTLCPKGFGVVQVQLVVNLFREARCGRACAQVEDEFHKAVVGVEPIEELHTVHLGGEAFAFEILVFLAVAEVIDKHNVVEIVGVEAAHHTTADEARGSRNYYHLSVF